MHGVVKIKGLKFLYNLMELPEDPEVCQELETVEEGAWITAPPDIADWPEGADRPVVPTLGQSLADKKVYRLFKHETELEPAGFKPVRMTYGGVYSREQWSQLVKAIPRMRAFAAIPADPPEVTEAAWRSIREGR